jgi:hypothetical protein
MRLYLFWLFILDTLAFLIPHYETTDVALDLYQDRVYVGEELGHLINYDIICPVGILEPEEQYDAVGTIRYFTWLGFATFIRQIGAIRPFENPYQEEQ